MSFPNLSPHHILYSESDTIQNVKCLSVRNITMFFTLPCWIHAAMLKALIPNVLRGISNMFSLRVNNRSYLMI